MNTAKQQRAQVAWINELLHRMTLANTADVRMQLCAETKQAIAELQSPPTDRDPFREELEALAATAGSLNIYQVIRLRGIAEEMAADRKESVGFKG